MGMVKQELVHAGLPLPPHARAPLPAGLPPHADPAAHAARLEAYKKVMRCFMQGPYDLVSQFAVAGHAGGACRQRCSRRLAAV